MPLRAPLPGLPYLLFLLLGILIPSSGQEQPKLLIFLRDLPRPLLGGTHTSPIGTAASFTLRHYSTALFGTAHTPMAVTAAVSKPTT